MSLQSVFLTSLITWKDTPFSITHAFSISTISNISSAIEVVGVNAYDPRNLNVRSPDVHSIMGILVDTEYDGNRFNTHLMNVVECDRNSRTLKSLVDGLARNLNENHFKRFKGKKTNPFSLPTDGSRVAVKVIDQTGIEHMKILDVEDFRELGV